MNRFWSCALAVGVSVGRANDLDHRVDVVDGDLEALEDVLALERLVELELRAPDDDLVPVRDVVLEHLLERHDLRHEAAASCASGTSASMMTPNVDCIAVCLYS